MAEIDVELVIASNNIHKVEEIRKIAPQGFIFTTLQDINFTEELPETTGTITGNALQKARVLYNKTGKNCVADDSGLLITALDGAPGVDSAMYAGLPKNEALNIRKVLHEMESFTNREAWFVTVIALLINDKEFVFEGRVRGEILSVPRGENGFGYDPVFKPDGSECSFAEMTDNEKNNHSHRAIAVGKMVRFLKEHEEVWKD